jgi:hypothetical protein
LASYSIPEIPAASAVTAKRDEISRLVRQEATPERLLSACDELIELEIRAEGTEPASLEFRAALLYAQGDLAAAQAQIDELLGRKFGDDLEHAAPVGAALLTRIALDQGDVSRAMDIGRHELLRRGISPRTVDIARLAESWWWSVQTLSRTENELIEQYRRLHDAARRTRHGTRWRDIRLTAREWAEIGLLACYSWIRDPMLSGPAMAAARHLVKIVNTQETFLLTVNRSAPMWSDAPLPPPRPDGTLPARPVPLTPAR